jgi:hypothetical protein
MPVVDPNIGNNTVHLVTGSKINNAEDVWSNYAAVWHCNGDSLLRDASGNGFTISLSGASAVIPGIIGKSCIPSTRMTSMTNASYLLDENADGFTISAWVKLSDFPSSTVPVVELEKLNGVIAGALCVNPDSSVSFVVGSDTLKALKGVLEDSTWLYVAASYVWYNSNGAAAIYVNGLPIAATEKMNRGERIGNVSRVKIAHNNPDIVIDELRIAPDALNGRILSLDYYSQRNRADFLKVPGGITSVTSVTPAECSIIPSATRGDLIFKGNY